MSRYGEVIELLCRERGYCTHIRIMSRRLLKGACIRLSDFFGHSSVISGVIELSL